MECQELRDELSAFLDQEVSPERRAAIELHLGRCDACAREVEAWRGAIGAVAGLPRVRVPAGLAESIRVRLVAAERELPRIRRFAHLRRALAACAAVAAVLAVVLVRAPRTPRVEEAVPAGRLFQTAKLEEAQHRRQESGVAGESAAALPGDRTEKEKALVVADRADEGALRLADAESAATFARAPCIPTRMELAVQGIEGDLDALHASFAVESPTPTQGRIRVTAGRAEADRILAVINSRRASLAKGVTLGSQVAVVAGHERLKDAVAGAPPGPAGARAGAASGGGAGLAHQVADRKQAADKGTKLAGAESGPAEKGDRENDDEIIELVIELVVEGD